MEEKFDCVDEGCGDCEICKYLEFLDWASSVAPLGSTIQRNEKLDNYLLKKYGKTY